MAFHFNYVSKAKLTSKLSKKGFIQMLSLRKNIMFYQVKPLGN